jgi:hypothetical protein
MTSISGRSTGVAAKSSTGASVALEKEGRALTHPPSEPSEPQAATATGSGRTSSVSATSKTSVAGMAARAACSRIFSGLDAR